MLAFPLRTSTRYPGGFDPQTVGSGEPSRQTYWGILILSLWTNVRKSWAEPGDDLWMSGARRCAQPEESSVEMPCWQGFCCTQPVDTYW